MVLDPEPSHCSVNLQTFTVTVVEENLNLVLKNMFFFSFYRVPTMCDFEPLNRHVETLHQLVQAAQSVDEMSQTITDLLSEQRVTAASLATFYFVINK